MPALVQISFNVYRNIKVFKYFVLKNSEHVCLLSETNWWLLGWTLLFTVLETGSTISGTNAAPLIAARKRKVPVSFGNVAERRYTTRVFRGVALKLVIHFQAGMSSHRRTVNNDAKSRWTKQEERPRGVYWSTGATFPSCMGTSLRVRLNYRGTSSNTITPPVIRSARAIFLFGDRFRSTEQIKPQPH